MRLIDADKLNEKRHQAYPSIDHYCASESVVNWNDIALSDTVEAEPVYHGYWVFDYQDGNEKHYRCSRCGWTIGDLKTRYCAYCGTKMDDMNNEELKPCPFCGKTPELKRYCQSNGAGGGYTMYYITCKSCKIETKPSEYKDTVIKSWNRRTNKDA